jgi:hypothetical protein
MLDLVFVALASVPLVTGLVFVLLAIKENLRASAVTVTADRVGDPRAPEVSRDRSFPSGGASVAWSERDPRG